MCKHSTFSVELRELEAKLKSGYMNRERAAQLAEKFAQEEQNQVGLFGTEWIFQNYTKHKGFCLNDRVFLSRNYRLIHVVAPAEICCS